MTPHPRPMFLALAASLALMAAGCGMADYEKRIDAQQARMRLFDDESRQLGDAIDQPMRKDGDKDVPAWPFDVFLRLPKGYGAAPKEYTNGKLLLCRYAGKDGHNVFVAAGLLAERSKDHKYKAGEWPVEDFRHDVRELLQLVNRKELKFSVSFPTLKLKKLTLQPVSWQTDKMPAIAVEQETSNDEVNPLFKEFPVFRVYHHHQDKHQVAVVYQYPKAQENDAALTKAIDMSVTTLDIGATAASKRASLAARRKR